jgi:hypothetical protein
MTNEANRIVIAIDDNTGYSPDSVTSTLTISDFILALQEAESEYGPDAFIVLDNGQRYGARFGGLNKYRDLITGPNNEEDEDESMDR